jgi:hypothetical protein
VTGADGAGHGEQQPRQRQVRLPRAQVERLALQEMSSKQAQGPHSTLQLVALQVIGVSLSVLVLYAIAGWRSPAVLHRAVVELGKYSLFAYVAQIAVLQVLRRGLRGHDLTGAEIALPFIAALLATVAAVQAMALVRHRSTIADTMYRAVFA